MRLRRAAVSWLVLALEAAGCGAGAGAPGRQLDEAGGDEASTGDADARSTCVGAPDDSGIGSPIGCTVLSLNAQQAVQFCDWINFAQGGYGKTVDCGSLGPVATNRDRADCLNGLPDLQVLCPTLTVGQVEGCTLAQGPDLCKYFTEPACVPLRMCACVP